MNTISITRALVELKRYDDRINRAISAGVYTGYSRGEGDSITAVSKTVNSVDDLKSQINSSFQKVESLIANRDALKAAIVASNAKTEVAFRGEKITVANAIEKRASVEYRSTLLWSVRNQYAQTCALVDTENSNLDASIEKMVTAMYGSDKAKVDVNAANEVAKSQKKQKLAALINGEQTKKKIDDLESEISDIKNELDVLLSEINSQTMIEVNLD